MISISDNHALHRSQGANSQEVTEIQKNSRECNSEVSSWVENEIIGWIHKRGVPSLVDFTHREVCGALPWYYFPGCCLKPFPGCLSFMWQSRVLGSCEYIVHCTNVGWWSKTGCPGLSILHCTSRQWSQFWAASTSVANRANPLYSELAFRCLEAV